MLSTITESPIALTPRAIKALKRILSKQSEGKVLRIGVKNGGCSGMTYVLDFDQPTEEDLHFEMDDLPFVVNSKHLFYLSGMNIDYPDGLDARGFIFENPNASQTCGCGTSFTTGN